jgi:hypothetical protein
LGIDTRRRPLGSAWRCSASDSAASTSSATWPRVREDRLSEVGDGELARRALEEALAQARLERGHPPRDGGFGHAEALGRSREASLVHDAGEKQ